MTVSAFLPLLAACAMKAGAMDSGNSGDLRDSAETARESQDTESEDVVPAWIDLGAMLALVEGDLRVSGTSVTWTVLDQHLMPFCEAEADVAEAHERRRPPDGIFVGWNLTLNLPQGDCGVIEDSLPLEFALALGEMHPDLRAGLGSAGFDGLEDSLYGAYLSFDEWRSLLAFGVAGTMQDYDGGTVAAAEAPLPDGLYHVEPLYTLGLGAYQ